MSKKKDNFGFDQQVYKILGWPGRMISASKSDYLDRHSSNLVIFNANLFTEDFKFWYGDINVTKNLPKLEEVAKLAKTTIYLFREMDGRFDNETNPDYKKAVLVIEPNGNSLLGKDAAEHFTWNADERYYQIKSD